MRGNSIVLLWIVIFGIAAVLIFKPSFLYPDDNEIVKPVNNDYNNYEEEEIVVEELVNETINNTIPIIPVCEWTNYGYADYDGTQNEGKKCNDFYGSQMDYECLANPPTNYDGLINTLTKFSDPEIKCCDGDGTCRWN